MNEVELGLSKSDWKGANSTDTFRVMRHAFSLYTVLGTIFFLAITILEVWAGNKVGVYPAAMYASIATRSLDVLQKNLGIYFGLVTAVALLIGFKLWVADVIAVYLRKKLVGKLQEKYLHNNAFYNMQIYDKRLDNPDGRLTNDPLMWAQLLIRVIVDGTQSPIYIAWYGYKTVDVMGWKAALICLGFAAFSISASRLVMTPIIKLTYKFEAANAYYRLTNVMIRENAETIALSRGQGHERKLLDGRLMDAARNQFRLANGNILLKWACVHLYLLLHASRPDSRGDRGVCRTHVVLHTELDIWTDYVNEDHAEFCKTVWIRNTDPGVVAVCLHTPGGC